MASLSLDARFFAAATFTSDVKVGHVRTANGAPMHMEQHLPADHFHPAEGLPLQPAKLGFLFQVHEAKFDKHGEFQGTTKVMDLKVRSDAAGSTMTEYSG